MRTPSDRPRRRGRRRAFAAVEVRDAAGTVIARHDFADREVCEHEELQISDDLELEWVD